MKKNKFEKKIRLIDITDLKNFDLNNKKINLLNVEYKNKTKSLQQKYNYIKKCFDISFEI